MSEEDYKKADRQAIEDEILAILFSYLLNENKKYETVLKQLKHVDWKEDENDNYTCCN